MTSRDFCYWLQGYIELSDKGNNYSLTDFQMQQIKNHLSMVFIHEIDPSFPEEQQEQLNTAHENIGLGQTMRC